MKQRVLLLLSILIISISVFADTKALGVQLSEGMRGNITYIPGQGGYTLFWEVNLPLSHDNDPSVPGMPYVTKNIVIPNGYKVARIDFSEYKNLYTTGVHLGPNVLCGSDSSVVSDEFVNYEDGIYPKTMVSIGNEHYTNTESFVSIKYAPFEYEFPSKKVYRKSYNVVLHLQSYTLNSSEISDEARAFAKKIIRKTNGDEIDDSDHQIDYIVLTTEALKPAFEPLVEWKRMKGLKSQVITLEQIRVDVSGPESDRAKIKVALSFLTSLGLKYVLIGGDDTVIPVVSVYDRTGDHESVIPTDMYYACIDNENDNWHFSNSASLTAYVYEDCDMVPTLDVSRAPIRTLAHADNVVSKILLYEKNPKKYGWNNRILTAGCNKDVSTNYGTVEILGNMIYGVSFRNLWDGDRLKFYDTCPIVIDGESKNFSAANLLDVMKEGFGLMQMICSGNQSYWKFENDNFTALHAAGYESKQPFILTTSSQYANAFNGTTDPTLGESFLRSARSGVVAMLGSSEGNWMYANSRALSPSLQYEKAFYEALFSSDDSNKGFGHLVNKMKSKFLGMSRSYSPERYLQFSLNPYGDPEMQIFPSTPKDYKNLCVVIGPGFVLSQLEDVDYTFGVYDTIAEDSYQVYSDDYMWWFPIENKSHMSVMKFGYVPSLFDVESNKIIINGDSYGGGHYYGANRVEVGKKDVASEVLFKEGDYTFIGGSIEFLPGVTFEQGAKVSIIPGQTVSTTSDAKAMVSKRKNVESKGE